MFDLQVLDNIKMGEMIMIKNYYFAKKYIPSEFDVPIGLAKHDMKSGDVIYYNTMASTDDIYLKCNTCIGYGLRKVNGYMVPVTEWESENLKYPRFVKCPTCGSYTK